MTSVHDETEYESMKLDLDHSKMIIDDTPIQFWFDDDSEPWFAATTFARVLGYIEPKHAIRHHIDTFLKKSLKDVLPCEHLPYNMRKQIVIREAGLWQLALKSRMRRARIISDWISSRVMPKVRLKGMCSTHCVRKDVLDRREPRFKEIQIVQALRLEFPDIPMQFNRTVSQVCRFRPDILLTLDTGIMIAVEVDEFQHHRISPESEFNRMAEIARNAPGIISFVRINPDQYIDPEGIRVRGMFELVDGGLRRCDSEFERRMTCLCKTVAKLVNGDAMPFVTRLFFSP